ncbi:MAG: hypothetical protein K2I73_06435 [Eubacterium sp.]|nr:hypothetical protein [Eubacterium sp.]
MNENKYKETFKTVVPSEEAVERIYEMTTDKKKFSYKKAIRRVAAAAMAFILVIGGGFGIDLIAKTNHADNTLGIYIAYGSEKELVQLDSKSAPRMFYRLYTHKYKNGYNEKEHKEFRAQYEEEIQQQLSITRKFDQPVASSYGPITNENGEIIGEQYSVNCGSFVLDIDDYSKVDKITIEDSSKYGKIIADLITKKPKDFDEDNSVFMEPDDIGFGNMVSQSEATDKPDCLYEDRFNDKVVITGDELRFSRDSGLCTLGVGENEINTGYDIYWNDVFAWRYYDNIDFNIKKVKGSIVFTVDYIDGTSDQSTVNYHFDKDGYMILSMD